MHFLSKNQDITASYGIVDQSVYDTLQKKCWLNCYAYVFCTYIMIWIQIVPWSYL